MIVCSCNVLSDREVRDCLARLEEVPATAREVYAHLGCAPQCGRCTRTIVGLMQEAETQSRSGAASDPAPLLAAE